MHLDRHAARRSGPPRRPPPKRSLCSLGTSPWVARTPIREAAVNDTTPANLLTETTASAYVAAAGFRVGPVGRVGVELEYCVRDPRRPLHRPAPGRLLGLVAHLGNPLPGGSAVTIEPGGQLELS